MDILMTDGKISLLSNDLQVVQDRATQLTQRLYIRLNTHKDTWFMDLDLGINYLQEVFGIAKTKQSVDVLIQNQILSDEYVQSIDYFNSTVNGGVYSCQFRVRSTNNIVSNTIRLLATSTGVVITTPDGLLLQI